jgi:dolichyl-phosphate beta-glucosyltransferase
MKNINSISLVIPFHKDTPALSETITKIEKSDYFTYIDEVFLCHNGQLKTYEKEICFNHSKFKLLHTDTPGLGAGCRLGIEKSLSTFILITGSDLPFEWSDFDGWLNDQSSLHPRDIVIGSKNHPETLLINRSLLRKSATKVFILAKKLLIPIDLPEDTQGTIFIKSDFAKSSSKKTHSQGFFFTTELVVWAIKAGATFTEVPVSYIAKESKSSVSPFLQGMEFIQNLLRLRRQLKGNIT